MSKRKTRRDRGRSRQARITKSYILKMIAEMRLYLPPITWDVVREEMLLDPEVKMEHNKLQKPSWTIIDDPVKDVESDPEAVKRWYNDTFSTRLMATQIVVGVDSLTFL